EEKRYTARASLIAARRLSPRDRRTARRWLNRCQDRQRACSSNAYDLLPHNSLRASAMKAVILAGGLGTRISEETHLKPKPMIEIGGKPILWHIMKLYSTHGVQEFIICCGYKGYVIKEYFANYFLHMSDVTFDMADK